MEWIVKKHVRTRATMIKNDIVVRTIGQHGIKKTTISFYNNSHLKISQSLYIVCALSGNRLYFKQESMQNGYKLSASGNNVKRFVMPQAGEQFGVGDYNLEFDVKMGLYYIDSYHKLII